MKESTKREIEERKLRFAELEGRVKETGHPEDAIVEYTCPECNKKLKKSDTECPKCGAEFDDGDEEKKDNSGILAMSGLCFLLVGIGGIYFIATMYPDSIPSVMSNALSLMPFIVVAIISLLGVGTLIKMGD